MSQVIDTKKITTQLRRCFLELPQAVKSMGRMREMMRYECADEEPEHLMLIGHPGTGKSTLLKKLLASCPRVVHQEFTEVPILYTEIPARTTIKALAGLMLQNLGSEYWNRGDETARTHQLVTLIRACRCKLIILDEVNHLVDRGGVKTHYLVGDWIKQLGAATRTSIVLSGTLRSKQLLTTNYQLGSRFSEVHTLSPLSLIGERQWEFLGVLKTLESLLAPMPSIELHHQKTAPMIAFATNGRMRSIRQLLVRAVEVAGRAPKQKLTLDALQVAFLEVIFPKAPDTRNPFSEKFNGLPLTRAGEPFQPEEMTNADHSI